MPGLRAGWVPLIVLAVTGSGHAAPTPLCLKVEGDAGLRKLVTAELGHHLQSHRLVASGCRSTLEVQLYVVDGVRYLTVRIDQQIPVRHTYRDRADLGEKLADAISLALRHDPRHLERDPAEYSRLQRAVHSILRRGHNRYRLELFQLVARSGAGAVSIPGGGLSFTRGADHWQVFGRLYFGGSPGTAVEGRLLKICAGGDAGLTYELSARANTSLYFSAAAGVQLLDFEGRLDPGDPDSLDTVIRVGATLSGRVGVRLFRANNFDLDLFAMGYLPLFNTRDPDSALMDSYTPSLLLGLGVGF
jgi:hypothetical protein